MTKLTLSSLPPSRRRRFRNGAVAAGVILAGALAAPLFSRAASADSATPKSQPPPPKVTVASVEQKLLTDYEEITGRVDAAETVELRAVVSGQIDAVNFALGYLDLTFTFSIAAADSRCASSSWP